MSAYAPNMQVVFWFMLVFPYGILCNEIATLILARGGSKGVYLKNLQTIGGQSLVSRTIHTAELAGLSQITVSTDHPAIALEALRGGAGAFHRSSVTATDWAPSIWGSAEFLASRPDVSILVLLQATSPFTRATSIRKAIQKLQNIPADCVFSALRSHKLRWVQKGGRISPTNFDIKSRPRRQSWNGELLETGSFYISRRSLIEAGYFQNHNDNSIAKMSMDLEIISYEEIENTDVISVELVPERKGLILKHCEYYVSSRRHGTTVTRRYNDFAQLFDVLSAKYPYRAVSRLPPKRVVVGGGSPRFLQRRRAALQRWLTLAARHPVLAHDADLRAFLCEATARLDRPRHDEFTLAGTQQACEASIEDMQAAFETEREQLRRVQLGLGRLFQIFERVESRHEAERADMRELGAGLTALSTPGAGDSPPWTPVRTSLATAALLASKLPEEEDMELEEESTMGKVLLGMDALEAHRDLTTRLSRGLHAERAAAAAAAKGSAASLLRARHRYALKAQLQEAQVARAYGLAALQSLPAIFGAHAAAQANCAALWQALHQAL